MSWTERRKDKLPNLPTEPLSEEARQALIEHRRLMREQRAWAAANRTRLDAEWDALPSPPRTIAEHIAVARQLGEQDIG